MTYDLLRFFYVAKRVVGGCVLAGAALCSSVAHAGYSTNPGNYNVGYKIDWDHGIQPSVGWNPAPIGAPAAGNTGYGLDGPSGGRVAGRGAGRVNIGPTVIDVEAKVIPKHASVAKALGNFAKKALPIISTGMAIAQLLEELGYHVGKDAQGNNTLEVVGSSYCPVGPCYEYQEPGSLDSPAGGWYSSPASAAQAKIGDPALCSHAGTVTAVELIGAVPSYQVKLSVYVSAYWGTEYCTVVLPYRLRTPDGANVPYEPATWNQLEADIAARNQTGWPSGSAAPEALRDAVVSGEPIEVEGPPTVTGPSSVPGPKTTKTDAQGNVTTTNTTYNITYNNNTINHTATTVTTVNGVQQSTETVEEQPVKEEPPGQCEKYPDSAGCADLDTPDDQVPTATKTVTYAPDDLGFGAGSCPPPYVVSTSLGQVSLDLAQYCTALSTYVRPPVILVATFLAFLIVTGAKLGGDD